MEFCASCGNLLQIQPGIGQRVRFYCPTCPYVCTAINKIVRRQRLVKKELDPIFSGADAMKFASKTQTTCPRCHHGEAYFRQMQIRSADEPMSTFYQCCNEICNHQWRED
ncbi:DNA-directed RNA polymerase III subunit RPC10-like [Zingiber officinale]|uniref:DNA-directed RNA polymerase III subunit RPC10-like n=1 Tax=Zingiber officinale TaxID=94328 RepID=UPI001C4CA2E8|nr:DNA-directed RNA polymerase III subunit RPC10-like [Zingiber officinale]